MFVSVLYIDWGSHCSSAPFTLSSSFPTLQTCSRYCRTSISSPLPCSAWTIRLSRTHSSVAQRQLQYTLMNFPVAYYTMCFMKYHTAACVHITQYFVAILGIGAYSSGYNSLHNLNCSNFISCHSTSHHNNSMKLLPLIFLSTMYISYYSMFDSIQPRKGVQVAIVTSPAAYATTKLYACWTAVRQL